MIIQECERRHKAVPDQVRTIPSGLLLREVKGLAHTEKSIDRLLTHPGGPLVTVIDAPTASLPFYTHPTVALVVLTELGREHYARHLNEYRQTYPELPIPDPRQ